MQDMDLVLRPQLQSVDVNPESPAMCCRSTASTSGINKATTSGTRSARRQPWPNSPYQCMVLLGGEHQRIAAQGKVLQRPVQ